MFIRKVYYLIEMSVLKCLYLTEKSISNRYVYTKCLHLTENVYTKISNRKVYTEMSISNRKFYTKISNRKLYTECLYLIEKSIRKVYI